LTGEPGPAHQIAVAAVCVILIKRHYRWRTGRPVRRGHACWASRPRRSSGRCSPITHRHLALTTILLL